MQKAAIVIGVNQTGGLPVLSAAVSGAAQVADWLRREGFQVAKFLDTKKPVTADDIKASIKSLVDQGTLEQLVVYFSGHGFLNNRSEHWMLSGAPDDPDEAVSLDESIMLARDCGIPSVVFISDACRSVPQDLRADRVRGSLIFPNLPTSGAVEVEVDRFFAALPGEPALEMPLPESAGQFQGIYTACFLDAFRRPDPAMVRDLNIAGRKLRVVPNRSLKAFLKREVNRVAQDKSIKLRQLPESIVESGDECYLGRVARTRGTATRGLALPAAPAVRTVGDLARGELRMAGVEGAYALGSDSAQEPAPVPAAESSSGQVSDLAPATAPDTAARAAFDASVALAAAASAPEHFETRAGFAVTGAPVAAAWGIGIGAEVLTPGGPDGPALIRIHPNGRPAGSLVLRFADGSGTLIAALDGYIGSLAIENGGIQNLSYVPSSNGWRWGDYQQERARLERLRAVTAAAARLGVFRVERDQAGAMADAIRFLKCIDPTLGLYAAYAYADAGLTDSIRSVQEYSRGDLGADLFDIALLAGTLSGSPGRLPIVPACPMLSQGFGLLRVKGVHLAPALAAAANHLRPALWTTFAPAGMDLIEQALKKGELT